jgi:hypothetical protein
MPKFPTYILFVMTLLAGSLTLRAQEKPTITAAIDKNQILIGEPIRLTLDVKSPFSAGNILPQFDSLPHFELIEKGSSDSLVSAEGTSYHLEWKLTSFDSGTRFIPSFPVSIEGHIYKTDSLAVEVSYGQVDTSRDYHDIKGIIDIENPDVKYIPWIVSTIALIALFLFIWFIRHPFAKEQIEQLVAPMGASAFDEAMNTLDQLKKMDIADPQNVKKYYSGMNDTLRVFLNRRLGLVTMEKTSEELIHTSSNLRIERELFSKLSAALRMGDFVKFAKYIPGPYENDHNLETIRAAIINLNETGK